MWTLKYYRYYSEYEHKAETKEDALTFGCSSEDNGDISMHSLIDPDGNTVMDREDLRMYYIYEW